MFDPRLMLLRVTPVLLLALVVALAAGDTARAGTFNPILEVTIANDAAEEPSDFVVDFNLPEGDVNFAGVVSFIPGDWGVVPGSAIPVGTEVGGLDALATLGLLNSPCNQQLPVSFEFQNGSIDTGDEVSYFDDDGSGTPDFAEDKDNNGIVDAVDKYPDFLNRIFPDLQPLRRSAGIAIVAGLPILLQFLIFEPGTEINELIPSDEELGYPSVTVLLNAGDPDATPAPGAITDFCSELRSSNRSLGTSPDGINLYVNPQPGTYTFTTVAVGQSDADGDGFENGLDTCPFDPNVGNPRVAGSGDADNDGLDAACDPDDNQTNSDEYADGYLNRQDNCPLVPNGQPQDPDNPGPDETNQADRDLDQIGDACDPNPDQRDGDLITAQLTKDVVIGGGGPGGPPSEEACPDCFRPGDSPSEDGDGGGLSTGAIIGIVVGAGAVILVLGGLGYALTRRRQV